MFLKVSLSSQKCTEHLYYWTFTNGCFLAILQKVINNEVFLQWSKSSTKAFFSITDLINYRKHSWKVDKLNGLKLILHFWRRYSESSFKCKVIPWVTAEKVWNKLAAWQLFLNLYQIGIGFYLDIRNGHL